MVETKVEMRWFCALCFASDLDGSWGELADGNFCANCSASGSTIRIPGWAVKSIREQASWIGKRYYQHKEDVETSRELVALRTTITVMPGRSVRPVLDEPGQYWVEQKIADGSTVMMHTAASSPEEALAKIHTKLPYVPQ